MEEVQIEFKLAMYDLAKFLTHKDDCCIFNNSSCTCGLEDNLQRVYSKFDKAYKVALAL